MNSTMLKAHTKLIGIAIICGLSVTACTGNSIYSKKRAVQTSSTGMTVYMFDKDVAGSGSSACNGGCIALWPPVPAADGTASGENSTITREDGTKQLTYNNKPLYYYVKDIRPGDANGDNVGNVWHVIPVDNAKKGSDGYSKKSWSYGDNYDY